MSTTKVISLADWRRDKWGECKGCPDCEACGDFHRMSSPEQLASYDAVFDLFSPDGHCDYDPTADGHQFTFGHRRMKDVPRLTRVTVLEDGEVELCFDGADEPAVIATGCRRARVGESGDD